MKGSKYKSYNQKRSHQPQNNPSHGHSHNFGGDFFNFGNDFGFDFGIKDDFDDPFDNVFGGFGGGFDFPRIGDIHKQMMDRFNSHLSHFSNPRLSNAPHNSNSLEDDGFIPRDRQSPNQNRQSDFSPQMQRGVFSLQGIGPGKMITKTFCSKIDYSSGQPHEEKYQSQSISQVNKDGHRISERQEAYKNSRTGEQKAAHQRLLDDRGVKQIRKRNTLNGEQEEHNIFKGMQEDELGAFEESYKNYREKSGFQENYKYLYGNGRRRGNDREIGDGRGEMPYMRGRARRPGGNMMALPEGKK